MNYLFIDSNIYLKFYHGNKILKYLDILIDNNSSVIVTDQIVDEVLRNSVSKNLSNWIESKKNMSWIKPNFLYHEISIEVKDLMEEVEKKFKELKDKIELDFEQHLVLVSKQKDNITKKLNQLFQFSIKPTLEEESFANRLKNYGNPPGKHSDPIGDELSWVQLLNKLQTNDKLVIITLDKDYASIYRKKSYINAKLHFELDKKNIEYFVYSELTDGMKKFKSLQDNSNLKIEKFPSIEELEDIKNEEAKMDLEDSQSNCNHTNVKVKINGIYDEWVCMDCKQILFKQISDYID